MLFDDDEDFSFKGIGCFMIGMWTIAVLASIALTIAIIYFLLQAASGNVF